MNLEELRYDELGSFSLTMNSKNPIFIYGTFYNYAINAYRLTISDLVDLEDSTDYINNGRNQISSIAFWFLSLESYINTILKIVCIKKGIDFKSFIKKDLDIRFSNLLDLLEFETLEIKKTGIFNKLNEFKRFRNELFHDRNTGIELKFEKTMFSKIPLFSNQIDVMQSILICLEIFDTLRYCINGLDLMPNISLRNRDNTTFFEKLDILFEFIIKKSFLKILEKHSLQTKLKLDFFPNEKKISSIFKRYEVLPIFRYLQKPEYIFETNKKNTNIIYNISDEVLDRYDLNPNDFYRPNFISE